MAIIVGVDICQHRTRRESSTQPSAQCCSAWEQKLAASRKQGEAPWYELVSQFAVSMTADTGPKQGGSRAGGGLTLAVSVVDPAD